MKLPIQHHLETVLHHLYINPLEKCNLRCKICYTRKTDPILSEIAILTFIERYQQVKEVQTVTFCGGEAFTLSYFPLLLNKLTSEGKFIQIITNGTLDKLDNISHPNSINLIVSIDGLKKDHDANRGEGNFQKSTSFLKKAHRLGFHTEIFSIITQRNIHKIDDFEYKLQKILGFTLKFTYHPRKPPSYLLHHPESNIFGDTTNFGFLNESEMISVMKERNVFPPKNLGCYLIALTSDGRVFGCCEGTIPIGRMTDPIDLLITRLADRINLWERSNTFKNCLGCSQKDFMCGIKKYLNTIYA